MKALTIALMLAACAFSVSAQTTPQQWTFTATSEFAPNAIPLLDASGNPYPCTGQNIDSVNDPNPNCYNPLVVTTDWTLTEVLGVVTSVTSNTPDTLTNSACSANSGVAGTSISETNILRLYRTTFSVTFANSATITFTGNLTLGGTQFTGSFVSTGSCMGSDSGNFTATLFPAVNATYVGQFETSSGVQGVTFNLATDSNFNLTGTVTPASNATTCFSNMTIASPLANSFAPRALPAETYSLLSRQITPETLSDSLRATLMQTVMRWRATDSTLHTSVWPAHALEFLKPMLLSASRGGYYRGTAAITVVMKSKHCSSEKQIATSHPCSAAKTERRRVRVGRCTDSDNERRRS
jgi:hypothetical protein